MAGNLCHFELLVSDPKKTKSFYEKVFGWLYDDSNPGYTMVKAGEGPQGGIMRKPAEVPGYAMSVYFCVDDIDETIAMIKKSGGALIVPKMQIPMGVWAMATDPDGIPFGLFEHHEG
jgi:predicted enzyme related to lactoylglutathione lyase